MLGLIATTSAFGAGSSGKSDWTPLAGKRVVICPDNDDAGRRYAEAVIELLEQLQPSPHIRMLTLPNLPIGGDVVDFIDSRKDRTSDEIRQELEQLLESATEIPINRHASKPNSSTRKKQKLIKFHLTELGNANRLVSRHGNDLRFVPSIKQWIAWDGTCWRPDTTQEVMRRAQDTVLAIYKDLDDKQSPKVRKEILKHAVRSETAHGLKAMIALAESNKTMQIEHHHLDAKSEYLNVKNGTIDLRTGKLLSHRREDYFTRAVDIEFDPLAKCPEWMKFLNRIFGDNQELITFIQRAIGYSLSGETCEQCLFFLHGAGANGKSTLCRVLLALLGPWGKQADLSLLMASRGEVHPTGVADLAGSRLIVSSEIEEGRQFAEVLVKQLTGQDRIKSRFMRQDFFEYDPRFKIWIAANHKPRISGTDEAIWRRIHLVPFDVIIPPTERDRNLIEKLTKELPGILAWAVDGYREWHRIGLRPPPEVTNATNDYRADMDLIGEFLSENCVVDDARQTQASVLHSAYSRWATDAKEPNLTKNEFRDRLIERGFAKPVKSTGGLYYWKGIHLVSSSSNPTPTARSGWSGVRSVPSQGNSNADGQNDVSVHSTPLGSGNDVNSAENAPTALSPSENPNSSPQSGNSEVWDSGEGQSV